MTVEVALDGRRWLCDPGCGFSITGPIPLEDGATRVENGRQFSIEQRDDTGCSTWALIRDGRLAHIVDQLPVAPNDVRTGHLITSTDSQSPFTQHLLLMRHAEGGHVTITEKTVTTRVTGRATERREISAAEAVHLTLESGVQLEADEVRNLEVVLGGLRGKG